MLALDIVKESVESHRRNNRSSTKRKEDTNKVDNRADDTDNMCRGSLLRSVFVADDGVDVVDVLPSFLCEVLDAQKSRDGQMTSLIDATCAVTRTAPLRVCRRWNLSLVRTRECTAVTTRM